MADSYDDEAAKDVVLHNCVLSTLVTQERMYNEYYLEISANEKMAHDLLDMYREVLNKSVFNKN